MVHRTFRLSPARTLTVGFVILICIGTILLMLPFAVREGLQPLSWEDALFTSTSATCVTGLVVVDTITTFSTFGQVVIMLLVQIGGLGFMTFATIFALMMKKRISLRERLILQEAMNANSIEGIVRLIRKVIFFSILIEASAALIFTFHWARDMPLHQSIYFGVFHAISLFNNGGFDLFGDFSSFKAFVDDPLFNVVSYMLIFAGSVGFVVLAELFDYKHMRRLSLHTKVVLTTSGILWIGGGIIIFVLEYTNPQTLGTLDLSGKIYASFFQSVATRSAGTSTLDIGALRQVTQFIMIILMFIGAAPGSTGGGIKVTTFAVLIVSAIAMIQGREDVEMFRYRLSKELILRALTITFIALFLVITVSTVLSMTEKDSFIAILFETTSAVGTVGFSMGMTPDLTLAGKIILNVTMLIGRLGPLTLAFALGSRNVKRGYRRPEGKMMIG
ncbi:TrkH family potassium uptake protein [Paenibacillus guangzhouensis]|uniref:TrkH family potassium uptake protein n=1 Tax=Paenibacillus guangzhouensis TaxID=1473112 RepID=UPI001267371D|nr:TrkH family potassium uptake protein [Paenibacillus guangzhouensis]